MRLISRLLAATALTLALGTAAASAKTLVYCSEGSPEGFDPALYTAGTTFDASSRAVYNRLVEFKHGSTEIEPGLAESWEVSEDGTEYTFKLRPDVKFQTTDFFTPTRTRTNSDAKQVKRYKACTLSGDHCRPNWRTSPRDQAFMDSVLPTVCGLRLDLDDKARSGCPATADSWTAPTFHPRMERRIWWE